MHDVCPLLGALLALLARQEYHRWQHHQWHRKRRKPPEMSAMRPTP